MKEQPVARLKRVVSNTLAKVKRLALAGQIRISEHGYEELANDGLTAREILAGLEQATGIPAGHVSPAVLVTAYRPDPARWNPDFTERKP